MKKLVLTSALLLVASSAMATDPTTAANTSGLAVSAAICDTVKTTASATGVGSSLSNAAMASGATATGGVNPVLGTIQGSTSVYNNGLANNVSTGTGVGTGTSFGVANASSADSFKTTVPDVGSVKLAGSTSGSSTAAVSAGTNESGTALGATATQFAGAGSIVKDPTTGVVTASVTDTKASQSVATTTGVGGTASATGVGAVTGVSAGSTGVLIPTTNCLPTHDVNGNVTGSTCSGSGS